MKISEKYFIVKEIGKGGFSTVYAAYERANKENIVAVKVVPIDALHSKRAEHTLAIMNEEIRILQTINRLLPNNPTILRLHEVIREPKRIGIVTELLAGGELFDRIVEVKFFSEEDAARLVKKIARALGEVHNIGFVHRDLKPENLIYTTRDPNAEIKITDFGLSYQLNAKDVHKELVGTPGYVAPEVLTRRLYSPACDIWGLGVILYILLVGYPPFHGENAQVFDQIKRGDYAFHEEEWKEISEEARELVSLMLIVDPNKRITIKQMLEHPWLSKSVSNRHLPVTVSNLKKFNGKRKLRAVARAIMMSAKLRRASRIKDLVNKQEANVFNLDQLRTIYSTFSSVAGDAKVVNREQFASVMEKLGFGALPIERMFDMFDLDGNGTISYREFLVNLSTLQHSGEESLKFCFNVIDSDGSGSISRDELMVVLKSSLQESDHMSVDNDNDDDELNEEFGVRFEKIMSHLDANGDGSITFEEFKDGVMKDPDPILRDLFFSPMKLL